ncbi:MAG: chorismate synthase [Aigarchaeota archaeon]|nr:chorismate synthase [Aigarchaeota archaeon]MDW8092260.1 chorismate synthase [Nitrososphaerota archaeon]
MTGNVLGERFVVMSFGESHGACVGALIDGCPAGLPISVEDIQRQLDLRRPGQSLVTTQRRERDEVEILTGVFNGYTTGAPILMITRNKDVDSTSYLKLRDTPRPSHADFFAHVKYGGFNDWRGGGRFSGRVTVTYTMAGALALKLLNVYLGIDVIAYTKQIGELKVTRELDIEEIKNNRYSNEVRCPDPQLAEQMRDLVIKTRGKGDSLGGIVECIVINVPLGLGEPVFSSLDGDIAKAVFAIPAVRGVEFGAGFSAATMLGSEHNDPLGYIDGKILPVTNKAGGIVGGLSTGANIVLRVAFKPPASIAKPQRTLNTSTMREEDVVVTGRHDPTVVPRAVPVVESIVAIVLADHAIRGGFIPPVIKVR